MSSPVISEFASIHTSSTPDSPGATQPSSTPGSTEFHTSEHSHPHTPAHTSEHSPPHTPSHTPDLPNLSTNYKSSPVKGKVHNEYAAQKQKLKVLRRRLCEDMRGKFIKMDPEDFLDKFLPDKLDAAEGTKKLSVCDHSVFSSVDVTSTEKELQTTFIECFENRGQELCPHYILVDTKDKPDEMKDTRQRVDACLFYETTRMADPKDLADRKKQSPNWDLHKLHIEFKRNGTFDAFRDHMDSFEGDSYASQDTRGQIISYSALVFKYQPRAFFFTLLVLGSDARILRWDRAGAVVTKKFDYVKNSDILCEFFRRFSCLNDEEQGIDTTVHPVSEGERRAMEEAASDDQKLMYRDYARVLFAESLKRDRQWWKVLVPTSDTSTRDFLVGTPQFYTNEEMAGRGTRGYVAFNPDYEKDGTPKFVWMKDAWRVAHSKIIQEGKILEILNRKGVLNIPTLLCHGDVDRQHTVTHRYWHDDGGHPNPIKRHRHYRMVVQEVGRSLKSFKKGLEFFVVFADCLAAHMLAYRNAKILHRDVSIGNMLIVEREVGGPDGSKLQRRGLLTDWELSKSLDENDQRQPHRTGTWQFMSAKLLSGPAKECELEDDLESFFHVMLYIAMRYLKHNFPEKILTTFMDKYFDEVIYDEDAATGGETKRLAMRFGQITYGGLDFRVYPDGDHPLNHVIAELLSWFKARYAIVLPEIIKHPAVEHPPETFMDIASYRALHKLIFNNAPPSDQATSADPPASSATAPAPPTDQTSVATQTLTNKLKSHDAFGGLLFRYLSDDYLAAWPLDDKSSDQLPMRVVAKSGYYQLNSNTSSKRPRRSRDDDGEDAPRSKRSRVSSASLASSRTGPARSAVALDSPLRF